MWLHCCQLCWMHDCIRRRWGHLFLGVLLCLWLKKHGLMPGLCFSNKLISQDKGLHCNLTCLLYSKLVNRLPKSQIVEIISSAIEIEMEFVIDALLVKLIGMNSSMMCNYIKFFANQLIVTLGCQRHYKTGNLFEWMERISLQGLCRPNIWSAEFYTSRVTLMCI